MQGVHVEFKGGCAYMGIVWVARLSKSPARGRGKGRDGLVGIEISSQLPHGVHAQNRAWYA